MLSQAERDKLVEDNLDFARALASKLHAEHSVRHMELDELTSYGYRGLVEAAQRFDPTRGAAFSTFAYYRVRGAIFDGMRETGWLNRSEYARYQQGANALLENTFERDTATPAGGGTGDTRAKLSRLASALDNVATIFVTAVDSKDLAEIADPAAGHHSAAIEREQSGALVREALATLPEKERRLVQMIYYGGHTIMSAGTELGLSKSWASRLHARAISLLGTRLGRAFGDL